MPPPNRTTVEPFRLSQIILPLLLAATAATLGLMLRRDAFRLAAHPEWSQIAVRSAFTLAWLGGMMLLLHLIEMVVWERVVQMRSGVRVPRLLRQCVAVLMWLTGLTMMLSQIWSIPASAVLATSGALGIIFGLALRNILADFFSGIALNIEQPFRLDEFIRLRQRGIREPTIGFVREINWRSTRIITPEDNLVIIPNSAVVAATIDNLDYPSPVGELELEIVLDWDTELAFSDAVLGAAMTETWAVGATHGGKPPKCRIRRLDGAGVAYKITYMIDPHKMAKGPARHELLTRVHKHMRFAGLRPMPGLDALAGMGRPVQRLVDYDRAEDRRALLDHIEIFKALTSEERSDLAAQVVVTRPPTGREVVRMGEPGSSMFIVAAGVLEVVVPPNGSELTVRLAVLAPGDFFGEMSLLTGEARTATVTTLSPCVLYEVTYEGIQDILNNRDELAEAISRVVSARRLRSGSAAIAVTQHRSSITTSLAQSILKFFGRKST